MFSKPRMALSWLGLSILGFLSTSVLAGTCTISVPGDQAIDVSQHEGSWESLLDPNGPVPVTGVTRHYNFTITRQSKNPDGVTKSMLLANGQFPGPLIEANWGDMIEVSIHNAIENPQEGTAIHWHGIPQKDTPWYDGVPSIHQCPIAPGETFVYRFRAEVYGTTWWHAHYSAQFIDGLFGPLVIHGPKFFDYDVDLGPIILTDYIHVEYFSNLLALYHMPPDFFPINNNLINGKMPYDCKLAPNDTECTSNGITGAQFEFQPGRTYLLRLINAGGFGSQKFSIDNHNLVVVANDFVPVKPYRTKVVTLGNGQRSDVLVKATGKPRDAVWMRSDLDLVCLGVPSDQQNATAAVFYPEADKTRKPVSKGADWVSNNCANDPLSQTVPLFPESPGQPDVTMYVDITVGFNSTGSGLYYVNNSTYYANYGDPLLRDVYYGKTNYSDEPQLNVINTGSARSIRLVVRNYYPVMHTMHLHGTQGFWVLAEGTGTWDGTITNPRNPQRRDGHMMGFGSPEEPTFMVLQWNADNPGMWPFHCHLVLHSSAGLITNILQRPDLVTDDRIPEIIQQTCEAWDKYAATHEVPQIDSGLKLKRRLDRIAHRQLITVEGGR
ncbi:multicopper oxidase-domain-containing protein [Xylaria acuta]|nr:multicopper oxidase-domain-containing protein [Xylaria acuta]